jgi:hypothetical protein
MAPMDMVWAPFHTQCHTALLTVARTLPLFMDVPFTGPFSGLDAAVYHTEEAVDAPLEADAAEVSASGDGGGRFRRGEGIHPSLFRRDRCKYLRGR